MVKNKKASKRVPLNQRYNIHKKALAHDKKQRRLAKANPHMRPKLKKDPGIPNLNPFKAQILKNMEERHKVLKMQERQRALRGQDMARRRKIGDGPADDEDEEKHEVSLSSIAADAAARGAAFASAEASADADLLIADGAPASSGNAKAGESTRRAFYRHLRTVMEQADILLCVLDARDPLSCRAPAVEALALSQSPPKRIILVLNKIDLVPASVVQQWLVYLRREFPTVAFKASTQQQRSHLSAPGGGAVNKATEAGEILTGSGAAGADSLLQLIKNYSRSHELKRAVTVGVVGYPNVGKSSIINSLKRSRAVGVSSTPGFTRKTQEVHLDAKVTLLDCPGIIFDDEAGKDVSDRDGGAGLLLRNCISLEQIEDPEAAVDGILKRCAPEKLMSIFSIPHFSSTPEFLLHVAGRRGKLGRGGVPDRVAAARSVLGDWNSGKIPFFVLPPVEEANDLLMSVAPSSSHGAPSSSSSGLRVSASDLGESSIVAEWSKEFDLDSVFAGEKNAENADDKMMVDFISVKEAKVATLTAAAKAAAAAALERQMALETDHVPVLSQAILVDDVSLLKKKAKKKKSEQMDVDEDVSAPSEKPRTVKFAPETKSGSSKSDVSLKKKSPKVVASTSMEEDAFDWSVLQR